MSAVEHIFYSPAFADREEKYVTASRFPSVTTTQLHDDLWRVTRTSGEVLGYVERTTTPAGARFRAKRMMERQRRFLPIGDFWEFSVAMECFRG
jgi:hypothetical protein